MERKFGSAELSQLFFMIQLPNKLTALFGCMREWSDDCTTYGRNLHT